MKKVILLALLLPTAICANAQMKWEAPNTEYFHHQPEIVTPGECSSNAPSDAIVLFDGTNLDEWTDKNGEPSKWVITDGAMHLTKGAGNIRTKRLFGDCQLHIEWCTPTMDKKVKSQARSNSGVFIQSLYEVQVLDNYENKTYSNGQAGSIYKQHPPLVNACRPSEQWQTYDIIYTAPVFGINGVLEEPARITVLHNGVLVQNNSKIMGPTTYVGWPKYETHGFLPLELQDHGNVVKFRNIWIREL